MNLKISQHQVSKAIGDEFRVVRFEIGVEFQVGSRYVGAEF